MTFHSTKLIYWMLTHFERSSARYPCGILIKFQSHTRTVVRECCKGDEASQWRKKKKLTPSHAQTPIQMGACDDVVDPYICAKVRHDPRRRFASAHAWLCAPKTLVFWVFFGVLATRYSHGPWTDFEIHQNTPFRPSMCLFGVANIKSNNYTPISPN